VSVNAYMDTNHAIGLGTKSGSHLLGQKIDLTFVDANSKKKITVSEMSEEQYETIKAAAKSAGLISNWESENDPSSTWGDFALDEAMSIDKDGKIIEEQELKPWVSDGKYYNSVKKKHEVMGWKQRRDKGA
ncbi:hypothetical protein RCJ22_36020, partial [Vibrio sp. FNV 38]|nr:hypothetical protein [Vibrio sp. FNV 38]